MKGLLIQIVLSVLAGIMVSAVLYKLKSRRVVLISISILVSLSVLAGTFWLSTRPAPAIELRIDAPVSGTQVGMRPLVQGKAQPIPTDVYVLVHPLATNRVWVQDLPLVQKDGQWQVQVYLGSDTEGDGESYEIVAVSTNENSFMRLLRSTDLHPGDQLEAIPPYFAKSNLIVVKRTE